MAEPKGRLLVVDDNEDNRDLLARRLQRKGYDVVTAEDGHQALDIIAAEEFDLILLDIMMPGLSGLEVLEKLREEHSPAELPILMATAKSDSQDMVQALEIGANDYITKPIDFPVVLARVQSHLAIRSQVESLRVPAAILTAEGGAEPGTVFDGRYEILSKVGEGGFAVVYKARQTSTDQIVALKLLRSHRVAALSLADIELARFEREMRLIGKLQHPHIVRLIDSGHVEVKLRVDPMMSGGWSESGEDTVDLDSAPRPSDPGRPTRATIPYIVMEYIDGVPLSQLLRDETPMSIERAIALMLPVLSAVGAAHQAGVIHRDLKPPNILVSRSSTSDRPHPKVLDFGIAKLVDEDNGAALTIDSNFIGTPEYMAPEQARGEREISAASDQFSLAVLLYEAITGRRPFQSGSFMELVHTIAKGEFTPPSQVVDGIPSELEDVLLRALNPDPTQRFRTLESFGNALMAFASDDVRAHWRAAFDVPSDPPPRRARPDEPTASHKNQSASDSDAGDDAHASDDAYAGADASTTVPDGPGDPDGVHRRENDPAIAEPPAVEQPSSPGRQSSRGRPSSEDRISRMSDTSSLTPLSASSSALPRRGLVSSLVIVGLLALGGLAWSQFPRVRQSVAGDARSDASTSCNSGFSRGPRGWSSTVRCCQRAR